MPLSIALTKQPEGEPLKAASLRQLLTITHDDTPIMIKVGDALVHVREVRQVYGEPGEPVMKVLIPVDFPITTK